MDDKAKDGVYEQRNPDGTVVYHTNVPIDGVELSAFVPDEILREQEDVQAFVANLIAKMSADLYATKIQQYLIVSEFPFKKVQDDGVERSGRKYVVSILIGKKPIVIDPYASPEGGGKKLITVGNN